MAMMLYIYSYESSVSFRTTTQIYIAFMNVTIKHYEGHRLEWNTESLWQCIRANAPHGDDLCSAFNILHQVAYDTVFKDQNFFPDIKAIKDHINQLSFVGVTSVPGSESRVKFTFSHPTFLEFFAALHLTTLPLNEQLAFITAYEHHVVDPQSILLLSFRGYYNQPISIREDSFDLMIFVEVYLGLIGDKFQYNTSGATPFLKQIFLEYSAENGVCFVYKWVQEVIGWTTQQYKSAMDLAGKANYSMAMCADAYYSFLLPRVLLDCYSEISILPQDSDNLANSVHYIYLMKREEKNLSFCIRRLRKNKESNCHGLRFPLITSLTIAYYPHDADTLHNYKMKRILPDLKRIHVTLRINNWNQFNGLGSLSKAIKQHKIVLDQMLLNLKIYVHLDINIDRCSVEGKRISPYIGEINHVSLRHIRLTGVCNDNNFTQHLCKSVLEYSTYVENAAHTQSLIACIQQAQNLKMLSLAYYEGAADTIKQNEIFKNLPQTHQILNICGFELSTYTFCDGHCNVSSTLDIKLLVDALIERKNLHTLTISISNVEDMKILTQLTLLINLYIILDDSLVLSDGSVDKSIMLRMVNQLQHFPHLESFALIVAESSCRLSDYDKQMILSVIFDISPARDIQICLSWFGAQDLPQFMEITARHKFGIRHYRIHYLHLLEQRYNLIGANRYQKYVDISTYNDWDDGFIAYDYKDYRDLDNIF